MTAREEFEAAMQKLGASIERSKPADAMVGFDYQCDDTEFMWDGFKLGRAAALEEAAKECAQVANSLDGNTDAYAAAAVCVERVLALKD